MLNKNIKLMTTEGERVELIQPLNESEHCNVYRVMYNGESHILKWKENEDFKIGSSYYKTVEKLIESYKHFEEFLKTPIAIVIRKDSDEYFDKFGYLMREIPINYYVLNDYFRYTNDSRAIIFSSYKAQLDAAIGITRFMQKLHMMGYSMNIEPADIFVNNDTGEIRIVNSEKISWDISLEYRSMFNIAYLAPEIPRSDYKLNSSMETDRYALAIVLYRLFYIDHPMEGDLWKKYPLPTNKVEEYLYAIKPVFHFDPKDSSNRPTEYYAPNAGIRWKLDSLYSKELREIFITTFTDGIDSPQKRPSELEWISVLASTRDKLILLDSEREHFVNFDVRASIPNGCLAMKIGSKQIAIYPKKEIYEFSITGDTSQYATVVGDAFYDNENDCLSIRNLTDQIWRCYSPKTEQLTELSKGQEFPLKPGVAIEFRRENPKIIGEILDPLL